MSKANERQVGGDHYKKEGTIEHWDYAWSKRFDQFQYCVTKYVERWRDKDGLKDLKKAMHHLEKYIELVELEEKKALPINTSMKEIELYPGTSEFSCAKVPRRNQEEIKDGPLPERKTNMMRPKPRVDGQEYPFGYDYTNEF